MRGACPDCTKSKSVMSYRCIFPYRHYLNVSYYSFVSVYPSSRLIYGVYIYIYIYIYVDICYSAPKT